MVVYLVWFIIFLLIGFTSIYRNGKSTYDSMGLRIKAKRISFQLFLFFLCGLSLIGLRDGGGVDDSQYRLFYEQGYGASLVNGFLTQKEPVFILIRQVGVALKLNYKFMFFMYAALAMLYICLALKNYKLNKNSLTIYILGFFCIAYTSAYTTMRQTLAMTIILYYYSLEKPTVKQSIVLSLLAFFTHYGSIIVVLIEFIRRKLEFRLNKVWKTFIPIICLIGGRIIDFQRIFERITSVTGMYSYMNLNENYLASSNVGLFTLVMFAGYVLKVWSAKHKTEMLLRLESLQLIYFALAFLTSHLRWGTRIQMYYILFIPFIFIEDLKCISVSSRKIAIPLLAVLLIPCSIFVISQSPDIMNATRSLNFR